jgi:hypothetical protein
MQIPRMPRGLAPKRSPPAPVPAVGDEVFGRQLGMRTLEPGYGVQETSSQ